MAVAAINCMNKFRLWMKQARQARQGYLVARNVSEALKRRVKKKTLKRIGDDLRNV